MRLDPADYGPDVNHDLAKHIIAQRQKFARWFGGDREQSTAIDSNRATPASRDVAASCGVIFANAMLILIGRALMMLDRILKQHGETFIKEGGFSERMTAARVEEKRAARRAVDEDAPPCPLCGGIMRVRHSARGDFWGCINYPACRGTRRIESSR